MGARLVRRAPGLIDGVCVMRVRIVSVCLAALLAASSALAATISGEVTDATGAVLPDARVVLRDLATGHEVAVQSGADGRFLIDGAAAGTYLVIASRAGFADAARTLVVAAADQAVTASLQLEVGGLRSEVGVTAARSEREILQVPVSIQTLSGVSIAQSNARSTGDALLVAASVTPVGDGPFGVRPRLRGLDSTRLLVLVDGERLNTARQATDRTGAEVGLVSPDALSRMEVVNGAGTVLYGSDALSGTINIITNEPQFSPVRRFQYGFDGYLSSNEQGRRGTVTLGVSAPRYAVRVQAGADRFDRYHAGRFGTEDTRPLFASGQLRQADTVDDNFGFHFQAFPDPFNAPFVRSDGEIANSQAKGNSVNAAALISIGERRTLKLRYQRRRVEHVGFPDFAAPTFFNATSLPFSQLDRVSARYEAQAVTPWLANLSLTAYVQRTDRLLRNQLPVQFPVPSAQFFPITVMRLDITSETEQRVWSPGLDVQAVLVPARNHLLTAGLTVYQDRSSDSRTTSTATSLVGQVALGARGPEAIVLPSPVALGPPSIAHPVRVPDASLRDVGLFLQDEWRVGPALSVVGGLRGDFYDVTTKATPGYDVSTVVGGAAPAIDPATLPDPAGASYARRALTGDVGLLVNPGGRVHPFVRVGRSYRHPNLEEMLFAGPATIGSIAPNVLVKPEVGTNVDAGVKVQTATFSGGASVFLNQYRDFIAQDLVVAVTDAGPLAQATNYADVRIGGVEFFGDAPVALRPGVLTLSGAAAFTRGTITRGENPLDGSSLADTPFDNITPAKVVASVRFTDARGRWWVEYGARVQTDVTRVARTLLDSPFIIAQDLLSLDGFAVQRLGWGVPLTRGADRVELTFAIENLTNRFYREQFQFAPARGRTFTVGLRLGKS
jgi:hemoglobin/transferrin/lactoferrin receptor protein